VESASQERGEIEKIELEGGRLEIETMLMLVSTLVIVAALC
jgi:hypothetical protein